MEIYSTIFASSLVSGGTGITSRIYCPDSSILHFLDDYGMCRNLIIFYLLFRIFLVDKRSGVMLVPSFTEVWLITYRRLTLSILSRHYEINCFSRQLDISIPALFMYGCDYSSAGLSSKAATSWCVAFEVPGMLMSGGDHVILDETLRVVRKLLLPFYAKGSRTGKSFGNELFKKFCELVADQKMKQYAWSSLLFFV